MEVSYVRSFLPRVALALFFLGAWWIGSGNPNVWGHTDEDTPEASAPPEACPGCITDLWTLTYIRSRVSSTAETGSSTRSSTPESAETLVSALQSVYGKTAVQRAGVGRLLLHGTPSKVLEIKRFLALVDAPWPQVQMNMWAVQVSGSPEVVSERLQKIGEMILGVRVWMAEVQRALAQIVVATDDPADAEHWQILPKALEKVGVVLPKDGVLSLNESLLFLVLHPRRNQKVIEIKDALCGEAGTQLGMESVDVRKSWKCAGSSVGVEPFHRLAVLFAKDADARKLYEADLKSFNRFGDALYCFKDKKGWLLRPDAPADLIRTGVTLDRVLKSVTDAFAADMSDLFLDPLLRDIRDLGRDKRKGDGIALVGRTRIVVTSGLEAGLAPEMASFVESGRPKPFGKELLDLALPASGTGTEDTLTGASRALASLSNAQALALAALLSAEVEPAFTKVAPGIAINIRPTVLPDGGAARLTVDARFGVTSEPQDQDRTDVWRQAPPAGIASHNIRTDASVNAFDLFDISSFSVTASHPQTPFYVPILGRLPVIGRAFQWPRRNKETNFESLILVNTVILPRSVELHRFYGREIPEGASDIECRDDATQVQADSSPPSTAGLLR